MCLFIDTKHTMSKWRIPWAKIQAQKKRAIRATRARTSGRMIRAKTVQSFRVPIRWGSTELKFLDCAWNGVAINTSTDGSGIEMQPSSGVTSCISVPAQGDGESNRDGRKYTIKSVWLSGIVDCDPLANQADAQDQTGVYAALVLDTQANGATLVSENVFINPSTSGLGMLPQPLRNLQNSKRFRILASGFFEPKGVFAMTDGANTSSQNFQVNPMVNLSWKGEIVCDSIGTTANVSSASDNAIHLVMAKGTGATLTFYGKSRVRFVG